MLALQIKIVPVLSIYALCSLVPIWCARLFGVKDYTSYKVSWCRSGVILIFTVNQPQKLSSVRNSEREGQTLAANHDNLKTEESQFFVFVFVLQYVVSLLQLKEQFIYLC